MDTSAKLTHMPLGVKDAKAVRAVYAAFLDAWNRVDGCGVAAPFADQGSFIGFDGTPIVGKAALEETFVRIFAHHARPRFVAKVRAIRRVGDGVALMIALAGMIENDDVREAYNALQTLVLSKSDGPWQIELLQNTPTQFMNRAAERAELTNELRAALAAHGPGLAPAAPAAA